jgi:solute:Na+ symporter, SSS family
LTSCSWSILVVAYLVIVVLIGLLARKKSGNSSQYLNATRSLPLWLSTLAFIAANCGALDVVGLMSLGAQYGALAFHFYWIGAVPALIVLALWLLPAYRASRAVTIFEFLGLQYGKPTRTLVTLSMSVMTILLAGIALYAMAQVLSAYLHWSFASGVLIAAAVLLACTWSGGLKATIYNEILHFSIVLAAVSPLVFLVAHSAGGAASLLHAIPPSRIHAWKNLRLWAPRDPMDVVGLVAGLGIVLSFGYWSTDFILMQRALAVRGESKAQIVPLAAALAKLTFSLLIVVPGIAAPLILRGQKVAFDQTLPTLMLHFYPGMLADLGILGLLATLMASLSAHVSAVSAMWMHDFYQVSVRPNMQDSHYLKAGKLANAAAIGLGVLGAFTALRYKSLMEYIQLLLSTVNAPLLGIFAPAVLLRNTTPQGGFWGFTMGLACAVLHQVLYRAGVLHYGSQMASSFYGAIAAFIISLCTALILSRYKRPQALSAQASEHLPRITAPVWSKCISALSLAAIGLLVLLNVVFW